MGIDLLKNVEGKSSHIKRDAIVILLKKVAADDDVRFKQDFEEFLKKPKSDFLFFGKRRSSVLKYNASLSDDNYKYYTVAANSYFGDNRAPYTHRDNVTAIGDVVSVSARNAVLDTNTATITLKNDNRKYLFGDNIIKKGQCVIEPNDEVYISLTGLDGKYHEVFTGFVNYVTKTDDGLIQNIDLFCEGTTKRLRETRTNTKPSLDPAEAAAPLSIWEFSLAGKLPHQILSELMVRAYSNFISIPSYVSSLATIRAAYPGKDLASLTKKAKEIAELYSKEEYLNEFIEGKPKGAEVPERIFVYSEPTTYTVLTVRQQNLNKKYGLPINRDPDTLIGVITGTKQPAYSKNFIDSWPFFLSEWKSGLSICKEIAEKLFYEFYADPRGVLHFRPKNILLPSEKPRDEGRVGGPYLLKDRFVVKYNLADSDNVFTVMHVTGEYTYGAMGGYDLLPWMYGYYIDRRLHKKYGGRMAPRTHRIGLTNSQSCAMYARAVLDRLNGKARYGSIIYKGESRLEPGKPIYIERYNAIFYMEEVVHNFTAGAAYDTILKLSYGRYPIGFLNRSDAVAAGLSHMHYSDVLKRMRADNSIEAEQEIIRGSNYSGGETEVQRYINNLTRLTFPKKNWKGIKPMVWEDMSEIDYDTFIEKDNDLSIRMAPWIKIIRKKLKINDTEKIPEQQLMRQASALTTDPQTQQDIVAAALAENAENAEDNKNPSGEEKEITINPGSPEIIKRPLLKGPISQVP